MGTKRVFTLIVEPQVEFDIDDAIEFYNSKNKSLGTKFYESVRNAIRSLESHAYYEVKYDNVRTLLINKFPYMIHFTVNEKSKVVTVLAVICCYKNPDTAYLHMNP